MEGNKDTRTEAVYPEGEVGCDNPNTMIRNRSILEQLHSHRNELIHELRIIQDKIDILEDDPKFAAKLDRFNNMRRH